MVRFDALELPLMRGYCQNAMQKAATKIPFKSFRAGAADIDAGFRMRRLWVALAREDIGDQHRLTTLGPIWLLLNYLLFVGTFVFVFSHGDSSHPDYPAYVAVGLFVWLYMSELISQSLTLFIRERGFIQGTTLPLTVYVMRLTMQSLIRSSYSLLGCLVILLVAWPAFSPVWLMSGCSLLLIAAISPAIIIVLAFLGTYFPDSQYIVSNIMRIGMFLAPVFWYYDGTGGVRHAFYFWNPFTYFIEIVRMPVTQGEFPVQYFLLCFFIGVAVWLLALLTLGRLRKQVVFAL
jgi:ABC-type polysaccharide/polyol phosphate export permease